jgi:hypothetical protein
MSETGGEKTVAGERSLTRMPVSMLRHYRTVLSRERDSSGGAVWAATVTDMPGCRATGSSRIEALDRVREMAERRSENGGLRRQGGEGIVTLLSLAHPRFDRP